jgi:fibronectin-binding autotransporter adhesin
MLKNRAILALILSLFTWHIQADPIPVIWNGGSGDWVDATQWTPSVVPNNGASTYSVTINSGKLDVVNLFTQNIFLDSVVVGPQATVNVNDQGLQLGNPLSATQMLANAGSMNFTNAGSLTLDYSGGAAAVNTGAINLGDESELFLNAPTGGSGTLTNSGSINLQNNPHGSQIFLSGDGATFTLNGSGALTLSDNVGNLITGSFGTESLVSDNKIAGAGSIAALANFTNNGSLTANGLNALIFNPDYSVGSTNLTGALTNKGTISVANGSPLVLKGANADFSVIDNGAISLNGQNATTRLIYDDGNNHHSLFLSGNGTLTLSDSPFNLVQSANGDETLFNQAGHTITGAGTIMGFDGGIVNNGSIIASGSNSLNIDLAGAAAAHIPGITNNGLIQVNDGSTLQITSNRGANILNAGSITLNANTSTSTLIYNDLGAARKAPIGNYLELSGTGTLTLSDNPGNQILGGSGDEGFQVDKGAKLSGAGTISNFGGYEGFTNFGTVVASGHNPLILDGTANTAAGFSALSNFGLLQVNDGSNFEFRSAQGMNIHNWGNFFAPGGGIITLNALSGTSTLSFNSLGNNAKFFFQDGPTGGVITMSDNPGNRIVGVSGAESLQMDKLQTISGAGTIGNFTQISNAGTIIANGTNPLILSLSPLTAGGLVSSGLIQVNDGSTLELRQNIAAVNVVNTGQITLNAAAGTSTLLINDQGINQAFVQSGGSNMEPFNALYLRGSGTLTMSNSAGNRIVGVTGDEALSNASTIQGSGTISNFGAGVHNEGLILANGSVPLTIDITAATNFEIPGIVNNAAISVQPGSTLQILSSTGGVITSSNSGNIFLAGGTLAFNDLGNGQTFTLASSSASGSPNAITSTISGNRITGVIGDEILINGANSSIDGVMVISNFAKFTNNGILEGVFDVQAPLTNWNGASSTLTGGTYIAEQGAIKLESLGSQSITNLADANVTIKSGMEGVGLLTGNGTVNALGDLANVTNSSITLNATPLSIAPGGGVLALTNSTLLAENSPAVSVSGNVSLNAKSMLETLGTSSASISGSLFVDPTSSIVVGNSTSVAASDFINTGSIALNAASTATFKGVVSNSGQVIIVATSDFSVVKSPFRAFGTNVYTQTAGSTKVLTGGVLNAATVAVDGGTLGGGGTINANVVVNGGTLAPGDPTITSINGDLSVNAGGTILLDIEGSSPGMADGIDVNGNLHLNGGTLDIVFAGGFLPQDGETWDLLNFTGIEDGAGFGNIVFENGGNEQFMALTTNGSFELETRSAETQATPEPSSLPALAALLACFAVGELVKGKCGRSPNSPL